MDENGHSDYVQTMLYSNKHFCYFYVCVNTCNNHHIVMNSEISDMKPHELKQYGL